MRQRHEYQPRTSRRNIPDRLTPHATRVLHLLFSGRNNRDELQRAASMTVEQVNDALVELEAHRVITHSWGLIP